MKIGQIKISYDVELELNGIPFYVSNWNKEEIEQILQLFYNITEEEEEQVISVLKKMFMVQKPCFDTWTVVINNRDVMFYLSGCSIMVVLQ